MLQKKKGGGGTEDRRVQEFLGPTLSHRPRDFQPSNEGGNHLRKVLRFNDLQDH